MKLVTAIVLSRQIPALNVGKCYCRTIVDCRGSLIFVLSEQGN